MAARDHRRDELAGHHDRRVQVDLKRPVDVLLAERLDAPGRGQCGVGDEDVEPSGALQQPVQLVALGEIGDLDLGADPLGELFEGLARRPEMHELRAARAQLKRDRASDAARCAGHKCPCSS